MPETVTESTADRVYIVDDDRSVRESLADLMASVGLACMTFGSAREFMDATLPDVPGCLVLDVRMPGMSGLDFQREMGSRGITLPVVFITGHGDIPMSVKAMKAGAIEFLTKPFREQDLLDAISQGLSQDKQTREAAARINQLRQCH
ncbi:MAG: response regulator, partial [Pseudomonas caspiana]